MRNAHKILQLSIWIEYVLAVLWSSDDFDATFLYHIVLYSTTKVNLINHNIHNPDTSTNGLHKNVHFHNFACNTLNVKSFYCLFLLAIMITSFNLIVIAIQYISMKEMVMHFLYTKGKH